MIRWLCYLPLNLLMGLAVIPLAPIAVAFFSTDDKRHLTRFKWMETIDNDLSGDSGWKEEHLIGNDPLSWLNRTRWLWRNGGNSVNYNLLGCDDIGCVQDKPYHWKNDQGYWLYRRRFALFGDWSLEVFMGWALLGGKQGRCKFVCSIRGKTKP